MENSQPKHKQKKTSKTDLKNKQKALAVLKQEIECDFGFTPEKPSDRIQLWESIRAALSRGHKKLRTPPKDMAGLSDKTLERMWGFEKGTIDHSDATYNALAIAGGYKSWYDFLRTLPEKKKKLRVFYPARVESSRLKENEVVVIGWYGIYYIKARYLGDDRYEVLATKGSKRKKGDIFHAKWFSVRYVRVVSAKYGDGFLFEPRIWIHTSDKTQADEENGDLSFYDLNIEID